MPRSTYYPANTNDVAAKAYYGGCNKRAKSRIMRPFLYLATTTSSIIPWIKRSKVTIYCVSHNSI